MLLPLMLQAVNREKWSLIRVSDTVCVWVRVTPPLDHQHKGWINCPIPMQPLGSSTDPVLLGQESSLLLLVMIAVQGSQVNIAKSCICACANDR